MESTNVDQTEIFVILACTLVIIILRLYVRIRTVGVKGFLVDDYLMVFAALLYLAETHLADEVMVNYHGLANNSMSNEERRLLDPTSEEYHMRVGGSKIQIAGWVTYTFTLWVIKAAICTFYLRLTDGLGYRWRVRAGFGILIITWIIVFLTILLGCHPLKKNWQIYPNPGNHCQPAISRVNIYVTLVLNVATDLYLMSLPMPMLLRVSFRPAKRLGLVLLFSGGVFVTVAAVLRCGLIIANPDTGGEQGSAWAVRETFVAIVTSNAPLIFPIFNISIRPFFAKFLSSKAAIDKTRSSQAPGAFKLDDNNPTRGRGPRTPNPITDFSCNSSDDHIDQPPRTKHRQSKDAELGGILKEVSVHISETRRDDNEPRGDLHHEFGDYYLAALQSAEPSEPAIVHKA